MERQRAVYYDDDDVERRRGVRRQFGLDDGGNEDESSLSSSIAVTFNSSPSSSSLARIRSSRANNIHDDNSKDNHHHCNNDDDDDDDGGLLALRTLRSNLEKACSGGGCSIQMIKFCKTSKQEYFLHHLHLKWNHEMTLTDDTILPSSSSSTTTRCDDNLQGIVFAARTYFSLLETLCLTNCPFANLPEEIFFGSSSSSSLVELKLLNCPRLSKLPSSIRNYTKLKTLSLRNVPNLLTLPSEIQYCKSLERLILGSNHRNNNGGFGSSSFLASPPPQDEEERQGIPDIHNDDCCFIFPREMEKLSNLKTVEIIGMVVGNSNNNGNTITLFRGTCHLKFIKELKFLDCEAWTELPPTTFFMSDDNDAGHCALRAAPNDGKSLRQNHMENFAPPRQGDDNVQEITNQDIIPRSKTTTTTTTKNGQLVTTKSGTTFLVETLIIMDCPSVQTISPLVFGATFSNLTRLRLDGCDLLETLPSEIGSSSQRLLETLELVSLPSLRFLPPEVGNLSRLKTLEVKTCHALETIPPEIGNLGNCLQTLDLRGCVSLQTLPKEIGQLTYLRKLNLSACTYLQGLPKEIGNLSSNLQVLLLASCSFLDTLPIEIGHCKRLTKLNLRDSGITYIPDEIFWPALLLSSNLRELRLGKMQRLTNTNIPNALRQNKTIIKPTLKKLDLSFCAIDIVWGLFEESWNVDNGIPYPRLEDLSLYHCGLGGSYAKILPNLPKTLKVLNLAFNDITELNGFCCLSDASNTLPTKGLKSLCLHGNPVLASTSTQNSTHAGIDPPSSSSLWLEIILQRLPYLTSLGDYFNSDVWCYLTPHASFLLQWNQCGRALLLRERDEGEGGGSNKKERDTGANPSIPLAVWPDVLARVRRTVSTYPVSATEMEASILFGFLREGSGVVFLLSDNNNNAITNRATQDRDAAKDSSYKMASKRTVAVETEDARVTKRRRTDSVER